MMRSQVFISYSSHDAESAQEVRRVLEDEGIPCWSDWEDIRVSADWVTSIVQAIGESRALVLLHSEAANRARFVVPEVAEAVDQNLPIFCLKIEPAGLSEKLRFLLRDIQWLKAFERPLEPKVRQLALDIRKVLGIAPPEPPAPPVAELSAAPAAAAGIAVRPAAELTDAAAPAVRHPFRRVAMAVIGLGLTALVLVGQIGRHGPQPIRDGQAGPPTQDEQSDEPAGTRAGTAGGRVLGAPAAGDESFAHRLRRVGLPPSVELDLGGLPLELVRIPAGTFLMGTPRSEEGRDAEEAQHRVTLTQPFYMGRYEVTQKQFDTVIRGPKAFHLNQFEGRETNPVEKVSWNDAAEFCRILSAKLGSRVRLPTEAEWEYACRAGTSTAFSSGPGEADLARAGWYRGNAGFETHPLGGKAPNPWSLFDMHGNVREWCQDWYASDYYAVSPPADPQGPPTGVYRISRGGGIDSAPQFCRCGYRGYGDPEQRDHDRGFRVVVSLQEPPELR